MFALKVEGLNLYVALENTFWVLVDTKTQAHQLARMGDAQALKEKLTGWESTEIVTV